VSTRKLGRMVEQIITSDERQPYEDDDPRLRFYDSYRLVWRGEEIRCHVALQRGVVSCPVCGDVRVMGELVLAGRGAEVSMRLQDVHALQVHGGLVWGQPVVDVDALRTVLGVAHRPRAGRTDESENENETVRQVLGGLWALQQAVIERYMTYSPTMHEERARGYDTRWQGREYRIWFSVEREPLECPLCGLPCRGPGLRVARGQTQVDVPVTARHLMEAHGLRAHEDWSVWNDPGDFGRLCALLGVEWGTR
jgi:hypothetical protein